MEIQQLKNTYWASEDFLVQYEIENGIVLAHCLVYSWKPSVLKLGYSVFKSFYEQCKKDGMEAIVTVTPNPKFVKLFGGETLMTLEHNDKTYEVIVWDLRPQHLP